MNFYQRQSTLITSSIFRGTATRGRPRASASSGGRWSRVSSSAAADAIALAIVLVDAPPRAVGARPDDADVARRPRHPAHRRRREGRQAVRERPVEGRPALRRALRDGGRRRRAVSRLGRHGSRDETTLASRGRGARRVPRNATRRRPGRRGQDRHGHPRAEDDGCAGPRQACGDVRDRKRRRAAPPGAGLPDHPGSGAQERPARRRRRARDRARGLRLPARPRRRATCPAPTTSSCRRSRSGASPF